MARHLLGKILCRRLGDGEVMRGRIVETEAYDGLDDEASHAFGGPTPRSSIMWGTAGVAYVYLIYGMWSCFNVVTGKRGVPSAVLIRGVHLPGDPRAAAGPGRLCRAMAIDRSDNGTDLVRGGAIWIADDGWQPEAIATGPRVNVDYAGEWAQKPWRFWIPGDRAVSR